MKLKGWSALVALAAGMAAAPAGAAVSGEQLDLSVWSTATHFAGWAPTVRNDQYLQGLAGAGEVTVGAKTVAPDWLGGGDASGVTTLSGQLLGSGRATFAVTSATSAVRANGLAAYTGYEVLYGFTLSAPSTVRVDYGLDTLGRPLWSDLNWGQLTDWTLANTQRWFFPAEGTGSVVRSLAAGTWWLQLRDEGTDVAASAGSFVPTSSGIEHRFTVTITPDATPLPPSVPGSVPEPATWALLVAGFGAVGLAIRRRTLTHVAGITKGASGVGIAS